MPSPVPTTTASRPSIASTRHGPTSRAASEMRRMSTATEAAPKPPPAPPARRPWKVILVVALVGVAGAFVASAPFSHQVSTDDAQVDGHITSVSPRISGHVDQLAVDDNQPVGVGDLLEIGRAHV